MAKPTPAPQEESFTPAKDLHVVAATLAAAFVKPGSKDSAQDIIQAVHKYRQFVRVLTQGKNTRPGAGGGKDE